MDKAAAILNVVASSATFAQALGILTAVGGLAIWVGGFIIGTVVSFIVSTREEE